MKRVILVIMLIALSIPGHATGRRKLEKIKEKVSKTMDSWLDHSKHELVLSWGAPDRVSDDGASGEILVYASPFYYYGSDFYYYKMFYVNSSGNIYSWRTLIKNIPVQQVNLNVFHY